MTTPQINGYSTLQVHDIIRHSGVEPETVAKVLEAREYVMEPTPAFTGRQNRRRTPLFPYPPASNDDPPASEDEKPEKGKRRRKKDKVG